LTYLNHQCFETSFFHIIAFDVAHTDSGTDASQDKAPLALESVAVFERYVFICHNNSPLEIFGFFQILAQLFTVLKILRQSERKG
jgi:hypothetical protein